MRNITANIKILFLAAFCLLAASRSNAQKTIAVDINNSDYSKRFFLYNTKYITDSIYWKNSAGKNIPRDEIYAADLRHNLVEEIVLFETDGSLLCIDTGGNFYMRDGTNPDSKPVYLKTNIDELGLGHKNIILECSNADLENLYVYAIPYASYKVSAKEPSVPTKLTVRLEDLIYGAKGKTPPRLLSLWEEEIKIDPEDRKILYEFRVYLPKEMIVRGKATMMIYDLSHQVVAIYPNLNKLVNVVRRENIMSATYVYKIFFGEEEVKKGLIHYLSPENEAKEKESQAQDGAEK